MLDEGVGETLQHGSAELAVVLGIADSGDDLLKDALFQEGADSLVLHALTHSGQAVQMGAQYHGGVASVQDADLSLLIRMHVVGPYDVVAGLLEGQLVLVMAADYPQVENLCGVDQLVFVADLLGQLFYFVPGGNRLRCGPPGCCRSHFPSRSSS